MPALVGQPLVVTFHLPGDVTHIGHLHDLPDQRLAADLAAGLAAATHPHGPITTRSVARQYMTTARRMARDLHASGFTGGLRQLTSAALVEYWLSCDYHRERRIRAILTAFEGLVGGLETKIVRHLEGRRINQTVKSSPNQPYSEAEWQRLTTACTQTISAAYQRHRNAVDAAGRGSDPVRAGVTDDNLAWLLTRIGPIPASQWPRHWLEVSRFAPAAVARLRQELFPGWETALAYNLLLAMRTGIVPDGVDGLTTGDFTHTGDTTGLLTYTKGRTGREALNLPKEAVRLMDRWLTHSRILREFAGDHADKMWIYAAAARGPVEGQVFWRPRAQFHRRMWPDKLGLLGDDGQRLPLHGGRIRATYHHRKDRSAWTGRSTIDPNHSARVEGDHYLSSHTPAQLDALESIIEQAQTDLRRKAEPPVILTGQDVAQFATDFPRLVAEAGLDTDAIAVLLSGEQDVFVAACASPFNSPHAPAGTLCPARPWVCLLCPLAAFTPRHLPNLIALNAFFSRQATQMTAAQFAHVFGPYSTRLDEEILSRFPREVVHAAVQHQSTAQLPFHLEELPS